MLNIKCLYGGCSKEFNADEIKRFVNGETYAKFERFYGIQYVLNNTKNKKIVNCPHPDCPIMFYVEEDSPFVECEFGHKSCTKCKNLGWHKKGKCNQVNFFLKLV